jgi:hypothetical protein
MMKTFLKRMAIVLMVCAMSSVAALAGEKNERVTFSQDITINGTLVKKGDYQLKFDEQTGEMSIIKDKKVVAKTSARLEKRDKKANQTEIGSYMNGETRELRSITFRGENQRIVVGGAQAAAQQ